MNEPEAMRVIKMLTEFRNAQDECTRYQAVERAIDAMNTHPDVIGYKEYVLDAMTRLERILNNETQDDEGEL